METKRIEGLNSGIVELRAGERIPVSTFPFEIEVTKDGDFQLINPKTGEVRIWFAPSLGDLFSKSRRRVNVNNPEYRSKPHTLILSEGDLIDGRELYKHGDPAALETRGTGTGILKVTVESGFLRITPLFDEIKRPAMPVEAPSEVQTLNPQEVLSRATRQELQSALVNTYPEPLRSTFADALRRIFDDIERPQSQKPQKPEIPATPLSEPLHTEQVVEQITELPSNKEMADFYNAFLASRYSVFTVQSVKSFMLSTHPNWASLSLVQVDMGEMPLKEAGTDNIVRGIVVHIRGANTGYLLPTCTMANTFYENYYEVTPQYYARINGVSMVAELDLDQNGIYTLSKKGVGSN